MNKEDVMEFKCFRGPMRRIEESDSELENMMEFKVTIFEKDLLIDELSDYQIFNDDYLQKESEGLQQEGLDEMVKPRIP
jgi:hypothetical protein